MPVVAAVSIGLCLTPLKIIKEDNSLVVRVPGYRSRSPGFDTRLYQIFLVVVRLERGPLSLVRITELFQGNIGS
jgi:hypothetical protein